MVKKVPSGEAHRLMLKLIDVSEILSRKLVVYQSNARQWADEVANIKQQYYALMAEGAKAEVQDASKDSNDNQDGGTDEVLPTDNI